MKDINDINDSLSSLTKITDKKLRIINPATEEVINELQ
jgi:hypothetical protein